MPIAAAVLPWRSAHDALESGVTETGLVEWGPAQV
jgi:hypothetical protein